MGRSLLHFRQLMCQDVRCRVCTPEGLTDSSESTWGVKQGCPLSPLLFSLYVSGTSVGGGAFEEDATDAQDRRRLSEIG
jgi:hypothetical protein